MRRAQKGRSLRRVLLAAAALAALALATAPAAWKAVAALIDSTRSPNRRVVRADDVASRSVRPLPAAQKRFASCRRGFGGAKVQLSGRREQLFIARSLEPPCRVIVGGYPASTHYARLRWMDVDIRLGTELWMHGKFFLPRDFYTRHESYMRVFMWLDNFNLDSTNPRRLELVMYGSDQLLRIMRQRQSREETQLWRYDGRLPLGKAFHLAAHYILSQTDGEALSELYIDGERVGSSTMANVTAGDASSARFTRAAFGIGGAAGQDGTTIELRMADLGVTRAKPN